MGAWNDFVNKVKSFGSISGPSPTNQGSRSYGGNTASSYNTVYKAPTPAPQPAPQPAPTNTGTVGGGTQSYWTGGTGLVAPEPPDPAIALRQQAQDRIRAILGAYDALNGGVDLQVQDQAGRLNQNYDQQTQNLNKTFEQTQGQTGSAYSARGLGQSSFLGDAMGQNQDVYNQNTQGIIDSRNNSLAELGKYAATSKAGFTAGKNQYNDLLSQVGNYDASALNSLLPQLQSSLGNIQSQAAGLGTNQQFINGLQSITPTQNRGAEQLASKLQQLVTSGAPRAAKSQLAQGLIKQAQLQDGNAVSYWQNYFEQLLNGQG